MTNKAIPLNVLDNCLLWYHNNNGEVNTRECFEKAIEEATIAERERIIDDLDTRIRRRFNLFFASDDIENNNWFIDTIINEIKNNTKEVETTK